MKGSLQILTPITLCTMRRSVKHVKHFAFNVIYSAYVRVVSSPGEMLAYEY